MLYEPGVPVGGRRTDLTSFLWKPRLGQESAELDRTATRRWAAGVCGVELGGDGFGFDAVVADGVPAASFFAGERIEAVVRRRRSGPCVARCRSSTAIDHKGANPKINRVPCRPLSPAAFGARWWRHPRHNVAKQVLRQTRTTLGVQARSVDSAGLTVRVLGGCRSGRLRVEGRVGGCSGRRSSVAQRVRGRRRVRGGAMSRR